MTPGPMMPRRSMSTRAGMTLLALMLLLAIAGPWLTVRDPSAVTGAALGAPSRAHPFGTDDLGRDVFAGVAYGASTSLVVGLVAASCSALIGLIVGGVAGLRGGVIDNLLMRGTEFVQVLPRFFLVVVIVSLFGSQLWLIVLVIGVTAWPSTARVFRAQVMTEVERDYVTASRAAGGGHARILARHILPVAAPVIAAQVSYSAGGAILAEAGLSFLGLGDPAVMSWGSQLGAAREMVRAAWWMTIFPGLAVTLTVLGLNLCADGLVAREDDHPQTA